MLLEYDYPLEGLNALRLPARAEWFLASDSIAEIRQQLVATQRQGMPCTVLGAGSNLVLADDLPGLVVRPLLKGLELVSEDDGTVLLRVSAGENWDQLVAETLRRGWYGLENLSLIPGSVGAGPLQNIGAYGVELADFVEVVEALSLVDGELHELSRKQCHFAYRDSLFKTVEPNRWLITAVYLRLFKMPVLKLDYGDLRSRMESLPVEQRTPHAVREVVCAIRREKLPDPAKLANAGSFFKNPVVSSSDYQALRGAFPELVAYPQPEGNYKLAAGWLIEQAGWKGRRRGAVGMHERQALVLVNHGGATGKDVLALAEQVRTDVYRMFAVSLEQEPVLLP